MQEEMPEPTTESLQQAGRDFFGKWQYPNCCGAIDGKHIRLRCPSNAGSAYYNYKGFHSMVLLAIVDANIKFIAIDAGSYGREGDAGIFLKSEMGKRINDGLFNIPEPIALPNTEIVLPNVILGDEAFSLHKNVMKPYPRAQSLLDHTKAIYNYRHSRARRTTENAFGVLCSYFRIFFTPIATKVDCVDNIVVAACVLHNMMRTEKISAPMERRFGAVAGIPMPRRNMRPLAVSLGRPNAEGSAVREHLKNYFNGVGAVHWQENMFY